MSELLPLASLATHCYKYAHCVCVSFAHVANIAFSGNIFTSLNKLVSNNFFNEKFY